MIVFSCRFCDFEEEYNDAPKRCPKCDSGSYTLTFCKERERKGEFCNIDGTSREHTRYSDALGVNPEQIPTFKKKFGDLMDFTPDGRCIIKSRQHKKKVMKARGYQELD